MNKADSRVIPDINQLIITKLRSYPQTISEVAIKAIQLSENLPEATVLEQLHTIVRDASRKSGGDS